MHVEKDILNRVSEGDELAFAELYAMYTPRLEAYIFKFTQSVFDTKEILQESFLRVWLHREKLPEINHFQAWIYKIAARECLQWLRRQKVYEKQLTEVNHRKNLNDTFTPEENIGLRELESFVQNAIAQLSELRKKIYSLNRDGGLKPAAIAEILNMPVGTVKNHLSASVKAIRESLVKEGYPLFLIVILVG